MARKTRHEKRSAISEVLTIGCKRHHVGPNQPCWQIAEHSKGLCGSRIRSAFPDLKPLPPEALMSTSRKGTQTATTPRMDRKARRP